MPGRVLNPIPPAFEWIENPMPRVLDWLETGGTFPVAQPCPRHTDRLFTCIANLQKHLMRCDPVPGRRERSKMCAAAMRASRDEARNNGGGDRRS